MQEVNELVAGADVDRVGGDQPADDACRRGCRRFRKTLVQHRVVQVGDGGLAFALITAAQRGQVAGGVSGQAIGRGFFFPMLSIMDILPGTNP
ncbi:hypothetical protein GCM10017559_04890 [Streptosporangium longisporum]|uniref:Uncharacterized protein n=1 Tax=Streptosporangium longisporum TaxID=46187 RepID=A0ABN3XQM3_9ACTN